MKYIVVLLCLLILLGLWRVLSSSPAPVVSISETTTESKTEEKEAPLINPVSLLALMEKKFDGRDLTLGRVEEDTAEYTRSFITYKSGALTISGILNVPKGTPPAGGWPVLFLNHGHIDTSIYTNGRGLRREQDYLTRQGFAVLHSDYRNHAQSDKDPDAETNIRLGYVEDVINAVYAVQTSDISSLSKERFGMLGHSMGGGIAQAVMVVKPDLVDGVVLYAPVSSDVVDSYKRWTMRSASNIEKIRSAHGSPEENPRFWEQMSPRTFFENVTAKTMIFHGTADDSCDIAWSRETRDRLLEAGKDVKLVEYPGEGHEFGPAHTDFMRQTTEFFRDSLSRENAQ